MEQHSGKLVLAILQGEDYEDTVYELNQNGFFVTMLSSTGGFLKKHSTTIMIGVEEPRLDEVLDILKRRAGQRKATVYQSFFYPHGAPLPSSHARHPCCAGCGRCGRLCNGSSAYGKVLTLPAPSTAAVFPATSVGF